MEQLSTEELLLLGRMGKQGVSDFLDGLKDPAYNKTKQTRRDDQKRLPLTTLGVARPRESAGDTTAHIWVAIACWSLNCQGSKYRGLFCRANQGKINQFVEVEHKKSKAKGCRPGGISVWRGTAFLT
jgi:hypothetical protein